MTTVHWMITFLAISTFVSLTITGILSVDNFQLKQAGLLAITSFSGSMVMLLGFWAYVKTFPFR